MSDRRLLLLALALLARPLAAQDDLTLLRRRVANLEAHREVLARAVARQDRAVLAKQSLQVVGAPPFQVMVPASAASGAGPIIDEAVAVAREHFGGIIDQLPPEVLTVRLEPDANRPGSSGPLEAPSHLLGRLGFAVGQSLEARVGRQLPDSFVPWIGGRLPALHAEGERVRGINALLADSTGRGVRCLEGEIVTCRALLAHESSISRDLRVSLVASVIDRGGMESWGKMAGGGTVEEALVRGAGVSMDSITARWVESLRTPRQASAVPFTLLLASGIGWALVLVSLFLWRVKWHHA